MKCLTDRMSKIFFGGYVDDSTIRLLVKNVAEDSVIWSNKIIVPYFRQDRATRGTDARINDGKVNCAALKGAITSKQRKRSLLDIVWRNLMTDVDDVRGGID